MFQDDGSWSRAAGLDGRQQEDNALVRFSLRPVENKEKSAAEGRPIFEDVEYVEIMTPGDKSSIVSRALRETDKQRFRRQYAAWKADAQNSQPIIGTRLAEWPQVTRSQVEELRYFNVHTVEQLAEVSDGNIRNVGPIMALRKKAQDFVAAAKGNAPLAQLRDELAKRDNELEALRRQVAELGAALEEKRKRKGGD